MRPVSTYFAFLRHSPVMTAVMVVVLLTLLLVQSAARPFEVEDVMAAVPPLAAIFLRPRAVLLVAAAAVGCVLAAASWDEGLWHGDSVGDAISIVVISTIAVAASHVRDRRERHLAQARWVAAAAQHVLVQPLPPRLGRLAISSLYLAAEEEASVGGDLYAAALAGGEPRIMVADARGKGLAATRLAGHLFTSFRRAARRNVPLDALGPCLDRDLGEELAARADWEADAFDPSPAGTRPEEFITAVIVDFAGDRVRIANCGHPSPLLLSRQGTVRELDATAPAPPLGLGDLAPHTAHIDDFRFQDGDTLLLYTDGVTEARNHAGDFYPLRDRLPAWTSFTPDALLTALRADLRRHVGTRLSDDVVLVAVHVAGREGGNG